MSVGEVEISYRFADCGLRFVFAVIRYTGNGLRWNKRGSDDEDVERAMR